MFLLKKLVSIFLSLCFCLCLFTPVCFADDSAYDHTHNWVKEKIHSYSLEYNGVAFGIDVFKCSECALYLHTLKFLGYEVPVIRASPDTALGSEAAAMCAQAMVAVFGKEWYATKFEAGGGSASPGGVGRRPDGYVDDSGTPYIGSSGVLYIAMEHDFIGFDGYNGNSYYCNHRNYKPSSSATLSPTYICRDDYMAMRVSSSSEKIYPDLDAGYKLVAPIDGYYSVVTVPQYSTICDSSVGRDFEFSGKFDVSLKNKFYPKDYVIKLSKEYSTHAKDGSSYYKSTFFRATISGSVILQVVPYEPIYKQQTNITINNNTWNGNIYVDNSNKLTYIYPQYTTIYENNETVTNISNNPIIYNQETKQYYTYDQTTNNYYYITYGDPAPTPMPSPSPDPGGSGGGSSGGDGSGGGSGDTPSGGGSSWWEKLLDKLGSALIDGLLDAIKGILKLLFDLFSSILGWIIWLCSKVFDLFPFLPPGVGALLVGGVVVCFVLAFIKFIRG